MRDVVVVVVVVSAAVVSAAAAAATAALAVVLAEALGCQNTRMLYLHLTSKSTSGCWAIAAST